MLDCFRHAGGGGCTELGELQLGEILAGEIHPGRAADFMFAVDVRHVPVRVGCQPLPGDPDDLIARPVRQCFHRAYLHAGRELVLLAYA